jgi:hypothetical protein
VLTILVKKLYRKFYPRSFALFPPVFNIIYEFITRFLKGVYFFLCDVDNVFETGFVATSGLVVFVMV